MNLSSVEVIRVGVRSVRCSFVGLARGVRPDGDKEEEELSKKEPWFPPPLGDKRNWNFFPFFGLRESLWLVEVYGDFGEDGFATGLFGLTGEVGAIARAFSMVERTRLPTSS